MIHWLELIAVIFGGVLGGIALVLFGCMMISIFGSILFVARDNKRGISMPLDQDWKREGEEEKEEARWRG